MPNSVATKARYLTIAVPNHKEDLDSIKQEILLPVKLAEHISFQGIEDSKEMHENCPLDFKFKLVKQIDNQSVENVEAHHMKFLTEGILQICGKVT